MSQDIYIKSLGYKVSDSEHFLDIDYNVSPEAHDLLDETYYLADKGKKSGIKTIQKYIKRFPKLPHFKNHLAILYVRLGNSYKANQINKAIVEEHPDYLYGKLNLASNYYYDEEYDKMTAILGKELNLKALYPERDTFHVNEALNFLKISTLYYGGVENIEKAEECYSSMQEIEKHFEIDSSESEQVFNVIASLRMMNMQKMFKEEEKTKIRVEVISERVEQKTEAPVFTHPEIKILYENDYTIAKQKLEQILSLPRESLIEDLVKVLIDSVERYEHFENEMDEFGYSDEKYAFPVHAFFLLGELKASSALSNILNYLKRDDEFYDFWFSDLFSEYFWEPMYKICQDSLPELKQFMLEPGISTHTKSLIDSAVGKIAVLQPERRQEVVQWYKDIFNHFLNSKLEDNIIDSDLIAFMTWSVTDINAIELLPEIEELYSRNYATISVCGDIDDVKKILKEERVNEPNEILSITERYEDFIQTWYKDEADNNEDFKDNFQENFESPKTIKTEKKVGRNEPCPCGSGKKYKKCCLNN